MDRASGTLVAVLLVASLHACSDGDVPDATTSRTTSSSSTSSTATSPTDPAVDGSLDRKVDEAREILSRDEGQDLDAITVVSAESVQWPNSAYGCPLTDATYTPGPFAGYRIVLKANGQSYIYTGAEDTDPQRCLFLD